MLDNLAQRVKLNSYDNLLDEHRSQNHAVMTQAPNSYLFALSDIITDIPIGTSQYMIFDYDIPFLQVLLKGYIDYSGEAVNISNLSTDVLLRHIEGCSNVKFANIYSESILLFATDYMFLSGASYKSCIDKSVEWYKEIDKVMRATEKSKIVDHNSDGSLAVTQYENGLKVYINYSAMDVEVDGVTVPAKWYTMKGGA